MPTTDHAPAPETADTENPETSAQLGAAAGGIIGHQSGQALEGAALGAAVGGAGGYAGTEATAAAPATETTATENPEPSIRLGEAAGGIIGHENGQGMEGVAISGSGAAVPGEAAAEATTTTEAKDPVLTLGEELYNKPGSCVACHQAGGQGIPGAFPPLAGSEWVTGPADNLIRIQLRGLIGEIKVNETVYNGVMPPLTDGTFPQTDENIAAVLTYVRHTFGAGASPVTPEMVAEQTEQKGQPMLNAGDLLDPFSKPEPVAQSAGEIQLVAKPDTGLPSPGLGLPAFAIFLIVIITALSAIALIRMTAAKK